MRPTRPEHRGRRPARHRPPTLEPLERRVALATFSVTSPSDSGPGSLRQAILDANATPGADQIAFAIPGGGAPVIAPLSSLPGATDPLTIDASSQPGFAGSPLVTLDGSRAGAGAHGLVLMGGSSVVRGLAITGFDDYAVIISGDGGDVLRGNFLGVAPSGSVAAGNRRGGVLILGSSGNRVGVPEFGGGNVISGNGGDGVTILGPGSLVTGAAADSNVVVTNYIGLSSTGDAAVPNAGDGVRIVGGSGNLIGGAGAGQGNVISGNRGVGVSIDAGTGNRVEGDLIGTDSGGAGVLGNAQEGVRASAANTVGGTAAGAANVIANNGRAGVAALGPGVSILSDAVYGNGAGLTSGPVVGAPDPPTLGGLARSGASAIVSGTIVGAPSWMYLLQFFASPAGEAQGRLFVGSSAVTTRADGRADFRLTAASGLAAGAVLTATATDPLGSTSGFSAPVASLPGVADVTLAPGRGLVVVTFDRAIDPTRLADARNYRVRLGRAVPVRFVTPSADGRSATIALRRPVPAGVFAAVTLAPAGSPGLADAGGVALDGEADGVPGGVFRGTVARGKTLRYTDSGGRRVTLRIVGGGELVVYRDATGDASVARLQGAVAGRSVLSGAVRGAGGTRIGRLEGAGGVTNRLTDPPFHLG